jgi:hypothetical protein
MFEEILLKQQQDKRYVLGNFAKSAKKALKGIGVVSSK